MSDIDLEFRNLTLGNHGHVAEHHRLTTIVAVSGSGESILLKGVSGNPCRKGSTCGRADQ